jgi:HlyD family secretion protein
MTKNKEIDKKIDQIRSDEVQEILGYIPNWTLRWGIGAIFVLILILLSISWIVKYPDYVNGQIIIKTTHPPIKQLANTNGQIIQLKIKDGTTVKKGEIIAEIKSLTSSKSIIWLNQKLEEVSAYLVKEKNKRTNFSPPNSLILGDFQTEYSSLLLSISDLEIERNNGNNQKKIQTLQKQIEHISKLTEINKRKIKWVTLECKNTKVSYENEKRMFKDGLISQTDFFTQEQRFIQGKLRLENFKEVFVNQQISKSSYQTQLDDFIFSNKEKQRKLEEKIQQIVKNISNNISKWKYMNNIEASESGTLTYLMPLHVNEFVSQDNALFAIIPKDKSFKGTMSVSTYGLGKININQQVYVKLDKYPFSQFGLLAGKVEKIYTIPTENRKTGEVENLIRISFDQTSSTTYHKNIKLNPENRGTAQIVTSDRRIIERIFSFLGEKNSR